MNHSILRRLLVLLRVLLLRNSVICGMQFVSFCVSCRLRLKYTTDSYLFIRWRMRMSVGGLHYFASSLCIRAQGRISLAKRDGIANLKRHPQHCLCNPLYRHNWRRPLFTNPTNVLFSHYARYSNIRMRSAVLCRWVQHLPTINEACY